MTQVAEQDPTDSVDDRPKEHRTRAPRVLAVLLVLLSFAFIGLAHAPIWFALPLAAMAPGLAAFTWLAEIDAPKVFLPEKAMTAMVTYGGSVLFYAGVYWSTGPKRGLSGGLRAVAQLITIAVTLALLYRFHWALSW